MISAIELKQMRAFAAQDGIILALLWTASFACTVTEWSHGLSALLLLSTPIVMLWRLRTFRREVFNDEISFWKALYYCLQMYLCGCILFAAVQLIYFLWLDQGHFFQMLNQVIDQADAIYQQMGIDTKELKSVVQQLEQLSPTQLIFTFAMMHLEWGLPVIPAVALIGKKRIQH